MTPPTRREARLQRTRTDQAATEKSAQRRRLLLVGGAVAVVLLGCAIWVGVKALTVKNSLEAAQAALVEAQGGGDLAASIASLSSHATDAAAATEDPLWRATEFIPALGDNLRAVRSVSEILDIVANDIGRPVIGLQSDGEGAILSRALPVLAEGGQELTPRAEDLRALRESGMLIGPVADGVAQVDDVLSGIVPVLGFLPGLLGADEARNYLLVFQNNAETLPLGGTSASQTMIRADAGDLEITGQASSALFDRDMSSIGVEIPEQTQALHGSMYGKRVNLSTSRPDWPSAAQMVAAFWNRTVDDTRVDGAISIDPLALSRILLATGPITVPGPDGDFELNHENAVSVLLSEAYRWWDAYTIEGALASDAFFAAVASSVFNAIAEGDFNVKDMAWAIGESVQQGSVYAWMSDPELQSFIESSGAIAGILPEDNRESTTVGIYLRDVSASKIDYYLDASVAAVRSCADGVTTVEASATTTLGLTQAEADALPAYVKSADNGSDFFSKHVFIYAPPGMELVDVEMDGRWVETFREGNTDLGRLVAPFQMRMEPGETVTVTATFQGEERGGPLAVRTTPTVRGTDVAMSDECG